MDLNRATILGRLTRDPEVRTTTTGKNVASVSVATNRSWTDQTGAKQEFHEYHNCVLWGKLADIAGQYLTKGRRVYMEGRLQTRDWTGTDGVKRYRTEIVVESMIMLEGPRQAQSAAGGLRPVNSGLESSLPGQSSGLVNSAGGGDGPPPVPPQEAEIKVEDIPF